MSLATRRALALIAGLLAGAAVSVALGIPTNVVAEWWSLLAAMVLVGRLLAAVGVRVAGRDDDPFERPDDSPAPAGADDRGVTALRRRLADGERDAGGAFLRLRPVLRDLAAYRLEARHGVDLDDDAQTAARLLGEPLWAQVDPDRTRPRDRSAPGIGRSELAVMVERLEGL